MHLHFWTDQTIWTIGNDLGYLEGCDVEQDRIRVIVNGLAPLIMSMPIDPPMVNFEYEKLEKHWFSCFALTHEEKEKDCPFKIHNHNSSRQLRTNQLNNLQCLEDEKGVNAFIGSPPKSIVPIRLYMETEMRPLVRDKKISVTTKRELHLGIKNLPKQLFTTLRNTTMVTRNQI